MKESNVLDKSNVLDNLEQESNVFNLEQLYNNIVDCFSKNNDDEHFDICNQILKDLIGQDSSVEIEYVDDPTASFSSLIRKEGAEISLSSDKKAIFIQQLNDENENEYQAILLYLDGKKVMVCDNAVKIIKIIEEKKFNNLLPFHDDKGRFTNDQFENEVNKEGEEENNLQNQQSNSSNSDEENNNKFSSLNNSINKMEIQTSRSKNTHILSNVCGYDLSWLDCCNICNGK